MRLTQNLPPEKGIAVLEIIQTVLEERLRQDAKWGEQNYDDATWALIAGEEFGEVQQAILHDRFGGKAKGTTRVELVQLTAVCLQWLECMDRQTAKAETEQQNGLADPELKPIGHSSWRKEA
jgi:hypothetical protein